MTLSKEQIQILIDLLLEQKDNGFKLKELGIDVTKCTQDWYKIVMILIKTHLNQAQSDLFICYVYEPDMCADYIGSLNIDNFYDTLISLKNDKTE